MATWHAPKSFISPEEPRSGTRSFSLRVEAGVETFYSEDLPGFDDLDGVRIVNPFK